MPDRLKKRQMRVVGVRQVMRALEDHGLERAFLALDAAPHLRGQIEQAAEEAKTPLEWVSTMEELARMCQVDVPSAAAGVLKSSGKRT